MATKTFKIGLSNTDKQNMAQDVYERLLALTFPEYDSAESYDVGDFVFYNDQLYKCIGATSGAWDSTKWQLATLNDLVTDIESAVAFVNDKANVDGNYPTMTVGVADQLSPYDDESGDDQDEPFSFQATGTGNGTQPDFSTGAIALMKEKQGNTVVVNQSFKVRSDATTSHGITITPNTTDNSFVVNGTSTQTDSVNYITLSGTDLPIGYFKAGHKYLVLGISDLLAKATTVHADTALHIPAGGSATSPYTGALKNDGIITCSVSSSTATRFYLLTHVGDSWNNVKANIRFIDLTQWFNGDIPQDLLDNQSNFFRYYQGSLSYNTGELVNSNGRYIKCIGMNQWDEVAESGYYDPTTGNPSSSSQYSRSKNFFKVSPNTDYYCLAPQGVDDNYILWHDKDKNFIGWSYFGLSSKRKSPANACYAHIYFKEATYNNDISINLYYEKSAGVPEPRCLTYEPYQVLTNNDTGSEVLRSAGSVKDIKTPDGTIHRLVGVVDLGTLNWVYNSNYGFQSESAIENIKSASNNDDKRNIVCDIRISNNFSNLYNAGTSGNYVAVTTTSKIAINSTETNPTTFKSAMNGVYLFYELAEPTTEQGTAYSENLVIDDFGSMDFQGTNGVPQGNLIFYPVDYKAFIDTLYNYTEGTPSNLALKSDLSADKSELQGVDSQLQNAIGGTLRNIIAFSQNTDIKNVVLVNLGEQNWRYENGIFETELSYIPKTRGEDFACTFGYSNSGEESSASMSDDTLQMVTTGTGRIWVKDTSYADATTFKNAMKGVLLAYEKA